MPDRGKEEALSLFCSDRNNELGIDTFNDTKNLKSNQEINRLQERLKTEKLDEKTRKTINETLKEALNAISLDNADKKAQTENNTVKEVTEDDLTKALRLSMAEKYKNDGQNDGSKTTDIKPLKRKVKKFKEGTKDD